MLNGLVLALGFYWPQVGGGAPRVAIIVGLTALLTVVNVRGIRQTAWVVNALTIGKLLPLCLFVLLGLFFANFHATPVLHNVSWSQVSTATLLLLFIFSGYEVIAVPAGEAADPRRHVPFAVVATILTITAVNTLVISIALAALPDLARSHTPVADAAYVLLGSAGALMIGIGSVISIVGNNAGQILSGSRMLFALAENGDLPPFLGRVHPEYRTPAHAVIASAGVALVLALSGSFVGLAAASAVARLVTYVGVCAATIALRRQDFVGQVRPAGFTDAFRVIGPGAGDAGFPVCPDRCHARSASGWRWRARVRRHPVCDRQAFVSLVNTTRGASATRSVAAAAHEAQHEQEQVDEVEVERERADDRVRPGLSLRRRERHGPQSLRVVGRQAGEDDHADERDHELQAVVLPEDPDDRRQHDADESHEEELAPAREAAARHRPVRRPARRTSRP